LEIAKQQIEYIKHVTTLSTGSIVLLAAFLEKLFSRPMWKGAVVVSFVGFLTSVVAAIVAHTLYVEGSQFFLSETTPDSFAGRIFLRALLIMWVGFLVGIVALGTFAVRNLW
jgi:hypothetical protein